MAMIENLMAKIVFFSFGRNLRESYWVLFQYEKRFANLI